MSEQSITSERLILQDSLAHGEFSTDVEKLLTPNFPNPVPESELGSYRPMDRRKLVTADLEVIEELARKGKPIPGFLEAGPRENLAFREPARPEEDLRVGVVTTGGLAPGLNSVVHSIVERHLTTYRKLVGGKGGVWGFRESFKGLAEDRPNWVRLTPDTTQSWLHRGGAELGTIRYKTLALEALAEKIADNLARWGVHILYIIGGDGSLTAAHAIAKKAEKTIVAGIPKTMDNDIRWVWQSFGFNSAVERAAAFINTMHCEAESTRRVAVLEFFGARSGFVAANAALASGHVDLVMIPEVFERLTNKHEATEILNLYREYLAKNIQRKEENPHAVIVIAEGVGKYLADKGFIPEEDADGFAESFGKSLQLASVANDKVATFTIQPRHYIRAIPANAHDQIYCKRLGALAVDNALAGFTDFMISQWLTEYVLVPLELVAGGQKHVPTGGIFWKQVVASTGQPTIRTAMEIAAAEKSTSGRKNGPSPKKKSASKKRPRTASKEPAATAEPRKRKRKAGREKKAKRRRSQKGR